MTMKWSEGLIARSLAMQVFNRKYLVVVPNCNWTGDECDILCVTENFRIIDVEVKISRADLRRDTEKDKWYHRWDWRKDGPYSPENEYKRRVRDWPQRVWKHYYALPDTIWKPDLLEMIPPKSGVILMHQMDDGTIFANIKKRAVPNRDARKIHPEDVLDIARLSSIRMWNALQELENLRQLVRTYQQAIVAADECPDLILSSGVTDEAAKRMEAMYEARKTLFGASR